MAIGLVETLPIEKPVFFLNADVLYEDIHITP